MSASAPPPPYPGNDGIIQQQPYNPQYHQPHHQNYGMSQQQPYYPNQGYPQQGYPQQGYPPQGQYPPNQGYPPQQPQPQVIYVNEGRNDHRPSSGKDNCCLWALLACCFGCCIADCCD